ncbi:HVO_A0114 family putative DNA-binding protein [Mangrovibrevibacter kandeliae]|uniref:HVO_A0114 family putative DNA-binding protein n=1 Tax=Mangrovibrevibacter kandeliae TaxID=2968473 RepID=UPI002117A61D|nr:transcriptional regulator [Aurantimonas sp. CSK15Z-1]MCQ8782253.1 transcriptional regulator [Aurantimonas sp. CSK15Z-1]
MAREQRKVTFSVSSDTDFIARATAAFGGGNAGHFITFATPELLWATLSPARWNILKLLAGQGGLTLDEIGRHVSGEPHALAGDLDALCNAGVIDRAEDGRFAFPYDSIHVDFVLEAA